MNKCVKCGSKNIDVKYVAKGSKTNQEFDAEKGLLIYLRNSECKYFVEVEHLFRRCECGYISRVKTLDNK